MRGVTIFALLLALAGCAGTRFSYETARQVKVGMAESQVISIMGRPYSVTAKGNEQMWVWSWANGFSGNARAVSFKFQAGRVTEVPDIPDSFASGKRTVLAASPQPAIESAANAPINKAQYTQVQLQKLMNENLPYDEYQKRYREIVGQ